MVSIIIPTLNSAASLPSLLEQLDSERDFIVVSDGMSEDATLKIAISGGAVIAIGALSRGQQLSRGAHRARGAEGRQDWLLFIHADSRLPTDWRNLVATHIETHSDKVGYFDLKLDSKSWKARIVEWHVSMRCKLMALPYGDQGLLISRELYDEIGGYPDWPLFEDVKIIEKIGRKRLRRLQGPITTSAHKFERDGFFKRGARNYQLLRRYRRGEPVEKLAGLYT